SRVGGTEEEPRVGLLETVREFAVERSEAAGELEALHARHAAHYLALAERAAPELRGQQQSLWLRRLEREQGNLQAALHWALESDRAQTAARLGAALWRYWSALG